MRILKPVGIEIEFDDGKIRHLLFDINVIEDVQEHFDMHIVDVLNSMVEGKNKQAYSQLEYILLVLLNEDVRIHNDENKENPDNQWGELTADFVRRYITNETSAELTGLVLQSFNGALLKNEDGDPNQKTGQKKR